jgi:hypothetical protein
MATIREILIEIPFLPSQAGDSFLITCRPLNIFIQADTLDQAKKDFENGIDLLFKNLIRKKSFLRFFYEKNLIISETTTISASLSNYEKIKEIEGKIQSKIQKAEEKMIKSFNPKMGNHSKLELAIEA